MNGIDIDKVIASGLEGRVAFVTGAGQGLGRAFAHAFAAAGAIPVIAEIDAAKAERVAGEIVRLHRRAFAVPCDVGDDLSVAAAVDRVQREFGRIDILVNNAAIFSTLAMRPFEEIPLDEWEKVMRVNVTGVFLCSRAITPVMRNARWGRIINLSSGAVTLGRPNYLHYVASKSAIIGMTNSMARELGGHGITVNAIMPGPVFTEIPRATVSPEQKEKLVAAQCIHRPETPEDLVGTVLFLASDASAFVTGQSITVDGGCTHP
jgi:NAD(P)-dependent dehydrogenase (short-subunit alcohol dehydrogenase family)